MKKIASFIGFGTLAAFATAGLFYTIDAFIGLGGIFDIFDTNGGYAFVALIQWLTGLGCIGILAAFAVIELIKMIPVFSNKEVEEKSLVHMNTIALFGLGFFFSFILFLFIECGIVGAKANGQAIVAFILSILGLGAVLAGLVVKELPKMVKVILNLAAQFLLLIVGFLFFGTGGLFVVFLVFQMIGLFGGMGYVILSNLDAFKK